MREIILSIFTTILGVILALLIDRSRMPKIKIEIKDSANSDNTYSNGRYNAGQRWKFFRVLIRNKQFPFVFRWLIRQTAENCRAKINIIGIDNTTNITFKGRWASTPELPFLDKDSAIIKLLEPDPITLISGQEEFLDIIAKYEHDEAAYGWNNEAYFNQWKTPAYKLGRGKYKINVVINTQNGISSSKIFYLVVGEKIEETYFFKKNIG